MKVGEKQMNCIFCKIANGESRGMKVYEDDHTMVIMDIAGDVDGHMLAIPKKHVHNILDCDEQTLTRLMMTVKKIANHCVDHCGYDGVNLLNASGESAGQSVGHFHIHIIPRKHGDQIDAWPEFDGAKSEISEIYENVKVGASNEKETM